MDEKSQNWCFDKNLPVLDLGGIIAIGKLVGKKVKTGIFFCFDKVLPACLSLRFHLELVPGGYSSDRKLPGKAFFSSIDR